MSATEQVRHGGDYQFLNLVPGMYRVGAAQAAQIQTDGSAVTNATDAQVINDVPNVTQNPLFYAMLQNGVQPRNETSTSTLGDL